MLGKTEAVVSDKRIGVGGKAKAEGGSEQKRKARCRWGEMAGFVFQKERERIDGHGARFFVFLMSAFAILSRWV
jgi:hypothetical protein